MTDERRTSSPSRLYVGFAYGELAGLCGLLLELFELRGPLPGRSEDGHQFVDLGGRQRRDIAHQIADLVERDGGTWVLAGEVERDLLSLVHGLLLLTGDLHTGLCGLVALAGIHRQVVFVHHAFGQLSEPLIDLAATLVELASQILLRGADHYGRLHLAVLFPIERGHGLGVGREGDLRVFEVEGRQENLVGIHLLGRRSGGVGIHLEQEALRGVDLSREAEAAVFDRRAVDPLLGDLFHECDPGTVGMGNRAVDDESFGLTGAQQGGRCAENESLFHDFK